MVVPELQRLTTTYDAIQDRIRLTGEADAGGRVVLWLTQRLLNRLVAYLSQWLEQQGGAQAHAALVLAFEQQVAVAGLVPQAPVSSGVDALERLVESVDVRADAGLVVLLLKGAGGEPLARLGLVPVALRQWLGIVHAGYGQAGWPMDVWPGWMEDVRQPVGAARPAALH